MYKNCLQVLLLLVSILVSTENRCYAAELKYDSCNSIEDVIALESRAIFDTNFSDHDELAQLYVSRGESFLLTSLYENALEDFHEAKYHLGYYSQENDAAIVSFRILFGEVVCFDNLHLVEETEVALKELQQLSASVGCDDCLDQQPCPDTVARFGPNIGAEFCKGFSSKRLQNIQELNKLCNYGARSDSRPQEGSYDDILGPEVASPKWCEEIIVGLGRSMDAIACLAPNHVVKVALIGVIETLVARGVKCCQAGGFWKACVAPIARKWKEWKDNKENHFPPTEENLLKYLNE